MFENVFLQGVFKFKRTEGELTSKLESLLLNAFCLGFSTDIIHRFSGGTGLYRKDTISPISFLGVAAKSNLSVSFFIVVRSGSTNLSLFFLV